MQPLDGLLVVARPGQVRAKDQAGVLGAAGGGDHRAGKTVVRGAAPAVFAPPLVAAQGVGLQQEFVVVLARVRAHRGCIAGQGQGACGQPLHVDVFIAQVGQAGLQGEYVGGCVQCDGHVKAQLRHRVRQVQHQGAAGGGPFHLTLGDGLGEVQPGPVRQQRALSEPAHAKGGQHRERLVEVEHEGRQRAGAAQRLARRAAIGQARAPVAPQRGLVGWAFED